MATPIPQPPAVPLLGNIFDIDTNNVWGSLKKLAEKYGEIFQVKVFGHTMIFVASVALAEEICDEKRFRKYVGGPIAEIRAATHDTLFTAYDNEPNWGITHRILAPMVTPDAVSSYFETMRDITTELLNIWKGLGDSYEMAPVRQLARLSLENTTYSFFGKRLNGLENEHPVLQAMEDSTSEAVKRPSRPGLLNSLIYGRKFKSAIKTMRNTGEDLIKYRRDNPTGRQDMLAIALNSKDPETGKTLTDSQVIDIYVNMIIGASTMGCLLSAAIVFLQRNPEVLKKAREELDGVIGSGEFKNEHLDQLAYLKGIVRESLRLSCPAPGFNIEPIPKEGDKSLIQLAGGKYQIAHNQPMIIVLAGVNRDPAVFEDPLAFKPERMIGDAFDRLPAGAKKWFGSGKRVCFGTHCALQWSEIVLAMMIKEVDFELANPNYVMEQDGSFNIMPVDLYVKVKPRAA